MEEKKTVDNEIGEALAFVQAYAHDCNPREFWNAGVHLTLLNALIAYKKRKTEGGTSCDPS